MALKTGYAASKPWHNTVTKNPPKMGHFVFSTNDFKLNHFECISSHFAAESSRAGRKFNFLSVNMKLHYEQITGFSSS